VVRRAASAILRRAGYTLLEAPNGTDALSILDSHPTGVDLLLTDVVMPGMSGPDLARRVADIRPEIRVLYMSGYTANIIGRGGNIDAGVAFLDKPFTPEDLLEKVRAVLESASIAPEQPE
jgi:CheY-like chemotaxis protein